jgi:YD repeat-containing protein
LRYCRDCFFYKTDPILDQSIARFEYDAAANGIGLLYQKTNAHAYTTYTSYDEMGRLLSETRTIGTTTVSFDYRYDTAGRQISKSVT